MNKTVIIAVLSLLALSITFAPAATAKELPTGTHVDGECVVFYEFPDAGEGVCVDKDGSSDCTVTYTRQTIAGPQNTCLVW